MNVLLRVDAGEDEGDGVAVLPGEEGEIISEIETLEIEKWMTGKETVVMIGVEIVVDDTTMAPAIKVIVMTEKVIINIRRKAD